MNTGIPQHLPLSSVCDNSTDNLNGVVITHLHRYPTKYEILFYETSKFFHITFMVINAL